MDFTKNNTDLDALTNTDLDALTNTELDIKNNSELDALNEKIAKLELELTKYKKENKKLNNKVEHLKERLDAIIDDKAIEILDYFRCTDSIRRTAWNYGMEMEELYHLIIQWDDCDDGLRGADDYIECTIEIYGRKQYDEEHEDEFTEQELEAEKEQKMRTPEQDTINKVIEDYKDASDLSLYELADRYDLWINNLFRLLKENNLIEKETDAKGYDSFYTEHIGTRTCAKSDKKLELGLIEEYYRQVINKSTCDNSSDTCDTCDTITNKLLGNKCFTCKKWNCNKCIIYKTETNIYYCEECFKNTNTEIRAQCNLCEDFWNIEDGTECNKCRKWVCECCLIIKQEEGSDVYYCDECYKNPEVRATCVSCNLTDNIEEGADCHKCKKWVCTDCVIFNDDGNYYCNECNK